VSSCRRLTRGVNNNRFLVHYELLIYLIAKFAGEVEEVGRHVGGRGAVGASFAVRSTHFHKLYIADIEDQTTSDISSNSCQQHYPSTLALVGRSLAIDQGPGAMGGSAPVFLVPTRRDKCIC
jgi:hypothetical protein